VGRQENRRKGSWGVERSFPLSNLRGQGTKKKKEENLRRDRNIEPRTLWVKNARGKKDQKKDWEINNIHKIVESEPQLW